jgi:hypothetical protein
MMVKHIARKTAFKYSTVEEGERLRLQEVANGRSLRPPLLDVIIEGDSRQAR